VAEVRNNPFGWLAPPFQDNLGKLAPKVKPLGILMKQDTMGWQWHQLDHMQIICTLLQTDKQASTSSIFYRPDALPDTQTTASEN